MNQASQNEPSIAETGEAIERRLETLNPKDAYWVLAWMAYGPSDVQEWLTKALAALDSWKNSHPQARP